MRVVDGGTNGPTDGQTDNLTYTVKSPNASPESPNDSPEQSNFRLLQEFVVGLSVLSRGTDLEKLQWAFSLYDINGDGFITKEVSLGFLVWALMGKRYICFNQRTVFQNSQESG